MKHFWKQLLIQLVMLSVALVTGKNTSAESGGASPVSLDQPLLSGTFIQLLERNVHWNRLQWEEMFNSFQAIGLRQIVVQWTLHDNKAFFATSTFEQTQLPLLENILQLAESRGIEVYIGLAAESRYWEMIKQSPVHQKEYLDSLRLKSEIVAQEVTVVASRYKAFKGWYIPEEIDDLSWRAPEARELLRNHLKRLTDFLKKLNPDNSILISCFSSARMDPDSYEAFWKKMLEDTSIDILLFQDGVGAAKLPHELLSRYLKAVRNAVDSNGKKLQVVIEL
jgi:hypothetical protein